MLSIVLSVLLTILKILGIIIASIIGILLIVLLTVLLVPIRYRGKISYYDKIDGSIRVSWLLRIFEVTVDLVNNKPIIKIKVFFRELGKKKPKKVKKKNKDNKVPNKTEEDTIDNNVEDIDNIDVVDGIWENNEETSDKGINEDTVIDDDLNEDILEDDIQNTDDSKEKASIEEDSTVDSKHKKNIFEKLSDKIKSIINSIKESIKNINSKLDTVKQKINKIKRFLNNKNVKMELKTIKKQLFKLIMHILPTKFNAYLKIGLGSPDKTGMALGYVGIFYGITGRYIDVEPDFDNKVFEGKVDFKGRIRLLTVLMILLKIYKQKRVITFIKNFNK